VIPAIPLPSELRELLSIPGVSGYEEGVVAYLRGRLPSGVTSEVDAIGNLTATFGRGEPHVMMLVHTDEVGFVVSGVRSDGALYLTPVGGWDLAAVGGAQVDVHTAAGGVPGVVITVPPHLDRGLSGPGAWIEGGQIVVDVGADDAAGVAALGVRVLDPVTLARRMATLPGGQWVSRGLDNRMGCFLLLELARKLAAAQPNFTLTLAWTSQEEVGFRGPIALARRTNPTAVLAIDAYPADRRPGAALATDAVRQGRGAVLRSVDLTGVGSVRFAAGLRALAVERGIALQSAYARGHNMASVFPGAHACALDLPVAYLHSAAESIHSADLDSAARLLEAIARHSEVERSWA
jgi:putative aminopeptidase FrvX